MSLKMVPLSIVYGFLFAFYSITIAVSCIISEILVKNRDFFIFLHSTPPRGSPSEYCQNVWNGKTRMVWLYPTFKSLMIRLAV